MSNSVIVFGPTGNIASIAAITAQEHGAKVYLAMRDIRKSIPGLSAEAEKSGGFERLEADMTQPDTVRAAVQKSGAKRAFIYVAHGAKDYMRATIEALKSVGIEFVVFLGSFTVMEPLKDNSPQDPIAYVHAQVEINLEEVFGPSNFVAIRPGGFVTNSLSWKEGISSGHLKLYGPDFKMDCITPGDMGRVSGTILVKGTDERAVYLYGPQLATQKEVAIAVAKASGNGDLKVTSLTPEEAAEGMRAAGVPLPIVNWTINRRGGDKDEAVCRPHYKEGVENVKKYTGKPAMGVEEWAVHNKALFV